MDIERVKQFSNEFVEQQIVSMKQFARFQKLLYNQEAVIPEPPQEKSQPSNSFDYAQMTRQQRRAYERRLAKENKRKH